MKIKWFDFSLKASGFPINEAKTVLDRLENLSDEAFEKYVETQKKAIVNFHLEYNPFYKKIVGNERFEEWNNFPVLTKKQLQIPLQERLSEGFTLQNVFKSKTSGSGGDPFLFAKDKTCHALTWAAAIRQFGMFGIDFNSSFQARFYGIPLDFLGYRKERLKDFLSCRYRFPIFNLSDEYLETVLQTFKKKKFEYINGYTSSIVLFGRFLQARNIILTDCCPTLKYCFVTSEMLFEDDKIMLEKHLGVPILNEYGTSETGIIAIENPQNEWLVGSSVLFVEILDSNNNPVPYGTEGKVVVTSLYNKAHPFIRYEVGDIGILDEKSTLRKPIFKKLIGRTSDIAILPSGKTAPGLTFYYVTKSIIADDGNVKEFIIRQKTKSIFEIDYVSENELTLKQTAQIEKAIAQYLEPNLCFSYNRKPFLERTARGKLKQFVSEVS